MRSGTMIFGQTCRIKAVLFLFTSTANCSSAPLDDSDPLGIIESFYALRNPQQP
jgi:hypothetical protein